MKELWLSILELFGQAWWVEVTTDNPRCTYFFGPFANAGEANAEKTGYVEDLLSEGAINIRASIKRCKPDPKRLTVYDESSDAKFRISNAPIFSGQL